MKTGTLLTAALLVASLPMFAQQQPPDPAQSGAPAANPASPQSAQPGNQPETPAARPGAPAETQPSSPAEAAPGPTAATESATSAASVTLMPVSGLLVSKLDTSTAKAGDDFVIETKSSVKTSDGTEIPKGSKLIGHVVAVQPSGGQTPNSQVAVNIDHAQLKGGQNILIRSEIQSLGSTESSDSSYGDGAASRPPTEPSSPSGSGSGAMGGDASRGSASSPAASAPGYAPGYTPGTTASSAPTPGTIVARNGHIAIRTTSMPGVLLANNAPGEQDPRMAQASGILLGAKKDVQLDSGTSVVVGVSAAASSTGAAPSSAAAPSQNPGGAQ